MIIPRRKPYFPKDIIKSLLTFRSSHDNSKEISKLEKDLSKKLGIPNPIVISSGRIGLFLILKASEIPKGSEIIIPGYTFGLLKNFIKKAGFSPVPVDINAETFQMSPMHVESAINKKTGAILATHIFGDPCDILAIQKIAKKHKLLLIEDCAEALGSTVKGKVTGTFGDIALSSFNIAKPLQGITGGIIFGKNKKIINRINLLISKMHTGEDITFKEVKRAMLGYFLSQTIIWPILMYIFSFDKFRKLFVSSYRAGDNTKIISVDLPPYLAHITRLNLAQFQDRVVKRRKVKGLYLKYLSRKLVFQKSYANTKSTCYMIVASINANPLMLRRFLALRGIDIAVNDEIADNIMTHNNSTVASLSKNLVALPIYENLSEQNIKFIATSISKFLLDTNKG